MSLNRRALLERAAACFRKQDLFNARAICQELLLAHPNDVSALEILARVEFDDQNFDLALTTQKRLVTANPRNVNFRAILGVMYTRMGRYDDAIRELQARFAQAPNNPDTVISLADAYEKSGDKALTQDLLAATAALQRDNPEHILLRAKMATASGKPDEAVRLLEELGQRSKPSALALGALGRAYEKLEDGDRAFAAYQAAKLVDRPKFSLARYQATIDEIIDTFTKEQIRKAPRASVPSESVILVAARPRSGTTLLSRIVGSHPRAFDSGENGILDRIVREISLTVGSTLGHPQIIRDLDASDANQLGSIYLDAVAAISNGAARVINKSLTNHLYLGLAQSILPNCRVIWCRRDAVDNCLACFSEDFNLRHPYTHDLADLGATHRIFERLMHHWQSVLEIPILELEYEQLVEDQEGQTRRIIEFCGLEWDERCLRFYDKATARKGGTPTLSYEQVRKPIYRTSVGRAKLFTRHLGPLYESLGLAVEAAP